jgi:hypothetical protein
MESQQGYAWSSPHEEANFAVAADAPAVHQMKSVLMALFATLAATALLIIAYRVRLAIRYSFGQKWALVNGECDYRMTIVRGSAGAELLFEHAREATASVVQIPMVADIAAPNMDQIAIPGATARVTVTELLFNRIWPHVLGSHWSSTSPQSFIAGQIAALPVGHAVKLLPQRQIRFAVLHCGRAPGLPDLQNAKYEAESVAERFARWGGEPINPTDLATLEDFTAALINADIVHIAAHADPDRIFLRNGSFSLKDLDQIRPDALRCRLLAISGCHSGNVAASHSLAYGFIRRGVNVIGSSDTIDDVCAHRFFVLLYEAMFSRQRTPTVTLAGAIRLAVDKLKNEFDAVEFDWRKEVNKFVLYGDPSIHLELRFVRASEV